MLWGFASGFLWSRWRWYYHLYNIVTLILMCYSESALLKLYRDSPYEYLLDLSSYFLPLLHLNAISQMEYDMKCVVNISLLILSSKSYFPTFLRNHPLQYSC